MMRRVGPSEDKGPMFWLVYEIEKPCYTFPGGVWTSRGYWSVGAANSRRLKLEATGRLAFVEAR